MAQRVSFEERCCRIEALGREGSWSVAEIAVHVGRSRSRLSKAGVPPAAEARGFYAAGSAQADALPVKAMRPRDHPKLVVTIPDWLRR